MYKYYLLFILFCTTKALAASITLPSTFTTDATDWVQVSESGTTPSITGFTTALVIVEASVGNIKITTTTSLKAVNSYCGYTASDERSESEPSNCTGSSLTEIGFIGSQSNINTALGTLSFKGSSGTITIKTYETASGVKYSKDTEHFYKVVSDPTDDDYSGSDGARAKALASSYNGLDGYLCNINSQAENDFLEDLFVNHDTSPGEHTHQSMWLGGYAASGETNTWRDGPDAGTSIPTSGSEFFYNWNSGEPNNTSEDYVVMYYKDDKRGKWNDTNNGAIGVADHYCIEYDHTDTLSSSSYATASLTLTSSSVIDSTTKSIIRSQTIASRSIIRQSIRNIHDRMQFTRNLDKNISQQNIKLAFNFDSETKNQIIDNFNSYLLTKI